MININKHVSNIVNANTITDAQVQSEGRVQNFSESELAEFKVLAQKIDSGDFDDLDLEDFLNAIEKAYSGEHAEAYTQSGLHSKEREELNEVIRLLRDVKSKIQHYEEKDVLGNGESLSFDHAKTRLQELIQSTRALKRSPSYDPNVNKDVLIETDKPLYFQRAKLSVGSDEDFQAQFETLVASWFVERFDIDGVKGLNKAESEALVESLRLLPSDSEVFTSSMQVTYEGDKTVAQVRVGNDGSYSGIIKNKEKDYALGIGQNAVGGAQVKVTSETIDFQYEELNQGGSDAADEANPLDDFFDF